MSLSAAIFGEDSTVWKIGNILGLGIPKLLNNLIATESMERAIGEIEKVTASEGGWRTIVWGRVRPIGGNTIFTGPPISYWMEETNEGKGNSDDQSTSVEHIFRSYAIGICEGPITKVTRVWRNNKLVYDARGTAWGIFNNPAFLKIASFHLGTFDQDPSWVLQVFLGADNVPAFRGTAYMVVNFEDLTDMAGSIPQYQFEVEREPPPSPPSYSPLVAKLIELGATEIWQMNDAGGGAVALYDSDNYLEEVDGSNFVYGEDMVCFPGNKMIDASSQTGDQSYFSTASAATGLHDLGDMTIVEVGEMVGSNYAGFPFVGLCANGTGSANNNIFTTGHYLSVPNSKVSWVYSNQQRGSGSDVNFTYGSPNSGTTSSEGVEFVAVTVRDGGITRDYINGMAGFATSRNLPTGGENCKFVIGRNVKDLATSARPLQKYSVHAVFKSALTAANVVAITNAALDMEGRFSDEFITARPFVSNNLSFPIHKEMMTNSTADNRTIAMSNTSGIDVGEWAYAAQLGTGTIEYVVGGGQTGTINGTTTSTGKGDIMKIYRDSYDEWTVTHG